METGRDDFIIAIRSAFLRKGTQQRFSLLSLILFSLLLLALGNFNLKVIKYSSTVIKEVIYFSSFIITVPENDIKNSFIKVSDHFQYYDKYLITQNELQKLKNKDLSKKIITYENIELKKLIEDYFIEDSQVYAKVLIDKESPFLRSIIINKGSKNDVKIGMIAYDDNFLIGKVVEVNYLTSRVLLISDINSKVPVTIQPLNIQAIMGGLGKQQGKLQYIKDEKLIENENEELIVVTSGSGGIFKSGIPIGKINQEGILKNDEIIIDFYPDFSQLKYVKILSHSKKNIRLDKSNQDNFEKNSNKITMINDKEKEVQLLQKQIIINEEIRNKLQIENDKLKENFINVEKKLTKQNEKIKNNEIKNENLKFLELNLLYGHKCRKTFLKPKLYKINTEEYKICVLKKGQITKKIR